MIFVTLNRQSLGSRFIASFLSFIFLGHGVIPAQAQSLPVSRSSRLNLPAPGVMLSTTASFIPAMLKGMKVNIKDPFAFEFIVDSGNGTLTTEETRQEADRLIKYFLTSLAIPEKDLWVNLSPYEKDRIITDEFGQTQMGRDLLAQDYVLKQLTASLIYPERALGEVFWKRVYEKARREFGTADVPVDTFNKVWIVPDTAVVYQNGETVYVVKSRLKVMLEEDYLALEKNSGTSLVKREAFHDSRATNEVNAVNSLGSAIIREIILPELEKEVNEGQTFAMLRQVYASLILAKWYKENLKTSVLNQSYANQKKIAGVDVDDQSIKEKIYNQYLEAFQKGVFNYIKEDVDPLTQELIPRKYFSGGVELFDVKVQTVPVTASVMAQSVDPVGSLSVVQGIFRERVSARAVNEYIAAKFQEGVAFEGQGIFLADSRQAKVYLIPGLLKETGQFGHIGLGAKENVDGNVVYESNGIPVVYLDRDYAENETVRANEKFKIEQWESKKEELGQVQGLGRALNPSEMRQWIKDNLNEAAELLQSIDQQAAQVADLKPLFDQARTNSQLPTDEDIARTYVSADDFKDLNLAAGILESDSTSELQDMDFFEAVKLFTNDQLPDEIRLKALKNLTGNEYLEYVQGDKIGLGNFLGSPEAYLDVFKQVIKTMKENPDQVQLSDIESLLVGDLSNLNDRDKKLILNEVIEPLFFANPEDLTLVALNKLGAIFKDRSLIKYFLFYVATRDKARTDVKQRAIQLLSEESKLFTLHSKVNQKLKNGKVEVLVVQNIRDFQGDELVRMHTLIQALLDFNPELRVTMVTWRSYLYDHPRVTIVPVVRADLSEIAKKDYDVIIDHYDDRQKYSSDLENELKRVFELDKSPQRKDRFMFIKTNKSTDNFVFEKVNVQGVDVAASLGLDKVEVASVYEPVYRLLAELGIPFSMGMENNMHNSLAVGIPNNDAEDQWVEMMNSMDNYDFQSRKTIKPVILINPFGGESQYKGYTRNQENFKELREHMKTLIANGFKLIILPNGQPWGTRAIAQEVVDGMDEGDRQSVVVGPLPQERPRFFKYFVKNSDYIVTVEGGMMHLGYILGKPMGVILKTEAGAAKWIPRAVSRNQLVINYSMEAMIKVYKDFILRRGSIENEDDQSKEPLGGIDFNLDLLQLEVQGQGGDLQWPQDLGTAKIHIENGLLPVILRVSPIDDFQSFFNSS